MECTLKARARKGLDGEMVKTDTTEDDLNIRLLRGLQLDGSTPRSTKEVSHFTFSTQFCINYIEYLLADF